MASPKMTKVAICGGGVGGLVLALVLHKFSKQDIVVDLYEAKNGFSEIGAGISIWKRTWFLIKLLGLDVSLGEMAVSPPEETPKPGFAFRRSDRKEQSENFYRMISPYGSITVHRADMLKVLVDNLPKGFHANFGKRLVRYSQNSRAVTLHFADGTTAEADVLVGADGFKSATRATMYRDFAKSAEDSGDIEKSKRYRDFIEPSWTGTYAYRTLLDAEKLLQVAPGHQAATVPLMYLGKDRHIVSYPISRGKLVNLIGFVSTPEYEGTKLDGPVVVDVPREEMINPFSEWEPEAKQLMESTETASRWAICHIIGLPQYVSGRVALLGDSAHAMTTHIGAGAGQAFEDAYVLGQLLAHELVNVMNLPAVLQVYESIRRPIGNAFVEHSRLTGLAYEFNHIPDSIRDLAADPMSKEWMNLLSEFIYDSWSWHWERMPDADWQRAEKLLHELMKPSNIEARFDVLVDVP